MTILGKQILSWGDKKSLDKIPLPLAMGGEEAMLHGSTGGVASGTLLTAPPPPYSDADTESMVFNRPQNHCFKSVLLFLIACTVMMMGVLGGYTLYRMYAPTHSHLHYRALCDIPYAEDSSDLPRFYPRSEDSFPINWRNLLPLSGVDNQFDSENMADGSDNYFREDIELDSRDDEGYAKIDVPDFKDGRRGRFMHDFKENQSAIIDTTTNRCFIMPLDRDTTLPPSSFVDLMQKMGSGYYNIDTERVRRNMHVMTPRVTDLSLISERIANECYDMRVYMLERFVSGVAKRSADPLPDTGKFAEFMGKGVVEYDIANIAELQAYENAEEQKLA